MVKENKINGKSNKKINSICGVSFWRILGYFIVYSFMGYVIEVLYGMVTKGVIESRQSFMYGPFCGIYGLGAILMVLPFKKHKNANKTQIFFGSAVIGCLVEYLVSWFGEMFLHVKWWDYSNYFLNVNGRVCLYFGIFWGILGIWLIRTVNPRVDQLIDRFKGKLKTKTQRFLVIFANIFLLIDCIVTVFALDYYKVRVVVENKIPVENYEYYEERYNKIYSTERKKKIIEACWGNETMIKTFPNLKVTDKDGNLVYLNRFYPEIQNYYYKIFDNEIRNINKGNI